MLIIHNNVNNPIFLPVLYLLKHIHPHGNANEGVPARLTTLNLETKSRHTGLVLVDSGLAFLLGVIGSREEHAVVASGLFGFADAARLIEFVIRQLSGSCVFASFPGGMCWFTLGFSVSEDCWT